MKSTSIQLRKGIFFAALILPVLASAQNENLVDNGSFEATTGKVKKLGQIDLVNGWTSPTGVRADIFMGDSKLPEIGAPANVYGREDAKEGENYAGIVAYSYGDKVPRTYIMTKLKTPLKKDLRYCVKFHLSLAEASKYSANQIGMNFSNKAFGTDAKTAIIDQTQVQQRDNKIFNATFNWDMVCGTYTAKGGEKYITIGNFTSNEDTRNERNKKVDDFKGTQVIAAYYYIDDVSVVLLDGEEKCDCGVEDVVKSVSSLIYQRRAIINEKMTPKQKVEAQGFYFAFGKAKLTPQATADLDLIAIEMKNNPALNITLSGHSDVAEDDASVKKPEYAEMDKKRVNEVKAYLVTKGVVATRIKTETKGHATDSPEVSPNDDDELKQAKNRRVTIVAN